MDLLASAAAIASAVFAFLAWNACSDCAHLTEALRKIYKLVKEVRLRQECLKPEAVLSLVEAARLLAEDAKELYRKTGDEKFLEVAERWEAFVSQNRRAVEKVLGYGEGLTK